jgi:hypothetical protein
MMHLQSYSVIIHHRYNWHYVRAFLNSPHSVSWGTCMEKNVSAEDMTGWPKHSLSYIANGETTLHQFKDETNIILSPILTLMLFFSVTGNDAYSSGTRYASLNCFNLLLYTVSCSMQVSEDIPLSVCFYLSQYNAPKILRAKILKG